MVDNQHAENPVQARIRAALQSDIPNINFNGMITSLGTADVMVVLERNGNPVAVLNVSYTAAKTLSMLLGNAIANLEELSGHPIMTTTEIEQFLTPRDAKSQKKAESTPKKLKH